MPAISITCRERPPNYYDYRKRVVSVILVVCEDWGLTSGSGRQRDQKSKMTTGTGSQSSHPAKITPNYLRGDRFKEIQL